MPHDVVHEVFLSREALLAQVATVRRLACVLPNMVHHMLLTSESLGAVFASIDTAFLYTTITKYI